MSSPSDTRIPDFLYGTAWKEDRTEKLVVDALDAGFTGIDTANQRKHYFEEAVGNGIRKFLRDMGRSRENLFLQTKYTYIDGQDSRLPYDPKADHATQVLQSFESSLKHLSTDYIDSYILHGPLSSRGIHPTDLEVWATMEKLLGQGKVKMLGVSNVNLEQLQELFEQVKIKPSFVQNRCYARTGWDREIRSFCKTNGIVYQGFSLLTANVHELMSGDVQQLCSKYDKSMPQIVFKFAQQVGMLPLTGTKNSGHMKLDLAISDFALEPSEIDSIQHISSI